MAVGASVTDLVVDSGGGWEVRVLVSGLDIRSYCSAGDVVGEVKFMHEAVDDGDLKPARDCGCVC